MELLTKFGNPAPSTQRVEYSKNGSTFFSYGVAIVEKSINGKITLDKSKWDYSATTGMYRNQFLGESITETRKKINSGLYALENLN